MCVGAIIMLGFKKYTINSIYPLRPYHDKDNTLRNIGEDHIIGKPLFPIWLPAWHVKSCKNVIG